MKKIFATVAMAGSMMAASPAFAMATNICTEDAACKINMVGTSDIQNGRFGNDYVGTIAKYTDYYTFEVPSSGVIAGTVSTISVTVDAGITLLDFIINGKSTGVTYDASKNVYSASHSMLPSGTNPQSLSVVYGVTKTGSYTGNVSWTNTPAVPEPGTWALMILGFGVVGYAMRRRPSVRFAQAI